MQRYLRRLSGDERGMAFVFVGMGLVALLGASTLAVDVGMFMAARNQAQNSADAGALAGAVALAFDDSTDTSPSGPAVQSALQTAAANPVMGQAVSITPEDVAFFANPMGVTDRVRIHVYRTSERGNPVSTLLGGVLGITSVDIGASATAEVSPANTATCLMPFTIPDKWIDNNGPSNCFEAYFRGGSRRPRADLYIPPSATEVGTGYTSAMDTGTQLKLRQHPEGDTAQPFHYLPVRLPGSAGLAEWSRDVATCNSAILEIGDTLTFGPGDMAGTLQRAVDERIAQDPRAYWDTARNRVVSSMNPSPRVVAVPLFDPDYYDRGRNSGRNADLKLGNIAGFFLESTAGDKIFGRITPIGGLIRGRPPLGGFARAIRLVE